MLLRIVYGDWERSTDIVVNWIETVKSLHFLSLTQSFPTNRNEPRKIEKSLSREMERTLQMYKYCERWSTEIFHNTDAAAITRSAMFVFSLNMMFFS